MLSVTVTEQKFSVLVHGVHDKSTKEVSCRSNVNKTAVNFCEHHDASKEIVLATSMRATLDESYNS